MSGRNRKLERHRRSKAEKKDTRMKFIKGSETVTLITMNGIVLKDSVDNTKDATTSLYQFIVGRITDEKFSAPRKGYEGAVFMGECKQEVDKQFKDKEEVPEVISLENETWKCLCSSIKDPTGGYDLRIIHCLVPIMNVIMEATDKDPREVDEEEDEEDGKKNESSSVESTEQ